MPRQYSEAAWDQMRQLFLGGMSIRQVAAKTGTPAGSVAAYAARHQWGAQRRQLVAVKGESAPNDPEAIVRAVVNENRLKTLEAESRSARLLAERCLKIIEQGGIDVKSLSDITESQEYRARLWPSVMPVEVSAPAEKPTLTLYYAHERKPEPGDLILKYPEKAFNKRSLPDADTPPQEERKDPDS